MNTMKASMNASVKCFVALGIALMAGCTVVPGSYHSPTPGWFLDEDEISEGEPLPDVVEVHAIGSAILNQTRREALSTPVP
jgi:polysaccharide biosynthesis/export protein